MKAFFRTIVFVLAMAMAIAEEKVTDLPAGATLEVRSWKVPPGFIPVSDPSGAGKTEPGEKSAQSYLETSGISFPEGSFARYDPKANKIVIRNTRENLMLIDYLLDGGICCIFPNPAVDIIALDCPVPASTGTSHGQWPTLEELRKLPASEIKVLSQISVLAKSGIRITSRQTYFADEGAEPNPGKENENFQPGEFGARLEVEAVVGPDGLTVDLNYRYQLRRPVSGRTFSELDLSGALLVQDNSSRIFHMSPLETEGRVLVLIAGVRMLDFDGTKTPPPWEAVTP
jgi:hypothetical protein